MKEVKAYKCDFCHRCFTRMSNAKQHEDSCKNNPIMRCCKTCIYGAWKVITNIGEQEIFGAYCDHHNKIISDEPYFIECEISYGSFGEELVMPFTCQCYEYKGKAEWTKENVEKEDI